MTDHRPYALLGGLDVDKEILKSHFVAGGFAFDQIDGHFAVSPPELQACDNVDAAIDPATEWLSAVNTTLRLSEPRYQELELLGIAQRRDGKFRRLMIGRGEAYGISGAVAYAVAGSIGPRTRSREERLISLISRDERIAEIAHELAARPMTWAAMNKAFESCKGIMSNKRNEKDRRSDHQHLIHLGWLTADESKRFYESARYHRHGYPRTGNPPTMDYPEACALTQRLLWRLVDDLERT